MSANLYEVLALGMRYWFVLLGVIIVLRSFLWLRRDRRDQHRQLRRLPDAGTVGELLVVRGSRQLPEGAVIAVPWEGVLGYNRTCDVVVPVPGVAAKHLDFSFEERVGLLLTLRHGCTCTMDGEVLTPRSKPRKAPMLHGSTLELGEAVLKLRVFAGIDVEHHVTVAEDPVPQPEQFAPYMPPSQSAPYAPLPWSEQPAAWQAPSVPGNVPDQQPSALPVQQGYPQVAAWAPVYGQQPLNLPPQGQQLAVSNYGQAGYPPPMSTVNEMPDQLPEALPDQADPAPHVRHRRAGRRDADA